MAFRGLGFSQAQRSSSAGISLSSPQSSAPAPAGETVSERSLQPPYAVPRSPPPTGQSRHGCRVRVLRPVQAQPRAAAVVVAVYLDASARIPIQAAIRLVVGVPVP